MPKQFWSLSVAVIVLPWLYAEAARAHGFWIYPQDGQIKTFSQNSTVLDDRLYSATLDGTFQTASSIEAIIGSGLEIPGDTFSIRLFGPLWYSTGEAATLAHADVSLAVDSYSDRFQAELLGATIRTGMSNSIVDLSVPGNDHDSIYWTLGGDSLPEGVYGVSYIVHVVKGNDASLLTSEPLVITLQTPGFSASPAQLDDARLAVFEAASVPEPTGSLLALVAVASAGWIAGRAKRRGNRCDGATPTR